MLLSYSLDIRRVNLFPIVDVCQLRYVMFLFNPKVTYSEYNLPSTAGHNDELLGRWLGTR